MKKLITLGAVTVLLYVASPAQAEEVTLIAPGGMRCPVDLMKPGFEKKTGHVMKPTIGAGGATHRQVVQGAPFDVPEVHVWTIRDGKVAAADFYIDTPLMLEALAESA